MGSLPEGRIMINLSFSILISGKQWIPEEACQNLLFSKSEKCFFPGCVEVKTNDSAFLKFLLPKKERLLTSTWFEHLTLWSGVLYCEKCKALNLKKWKKEVKFICYLAESHLIPGDVLSWECEIGTVFFFLCKFSKKTRLFMSFECFFVIVKIIRHQLEQNLPWFMLKHCWNICC